MKVRIFLFGAILTVAAISVFASKRGPTISGDYLEVRSCDVFTGPCFANAEMGIAGREAMMVWSVREGSWKGANLDGLSVIAVVRADGTLGDVNYQPRHGKAVLILDAKANAKQRAALTDFAHSMAGTLIGKVVNVQPSSIILTLGDKCTKASCASVKAGNLVEISTRCFGDKDHLCGNEETYYPPLTKVESASPAFTELAKFKGKGLDLTWEATGQRSAFLASFSR